MVSWYIAGMEIKIITNPISQKELGAMAASGFGDWIKAVVDVELKIIVVGADLHADMEEALLARGSEQKNLWGINLYPGRTDADWMVFDSMINVRPAQGNRSRGVENAAIQEKIRTLIRALIV